MAAARPQSVFLADIFITHLRLLLLRMFVLRVGRKWEMGQEERTGLVPMVFMIVGLQLMFLLLASVVGCANRE